MVDRISKLREKIPLKAGQAALITSPVNRRYLSGFKSSEGWIFITPDESYFFVDFRYYEAAKKQVSSLNVVLTSDFKADLLKIARKHQVEKVLIENAGVTLSDALKVEKWLKEGDVDLNQQNALDKVLCLLRTKKAPIETENVKIAQEIAENALRKLFPLIKPGVTEKELAFKLEFLLRKEGAEAIAFDLIVASGKNSAIPHAEPSDKPIEVGDFVTIDMGAVHGGYHSDMTRTVAVGAISDEQRRVYDVALEAQKMAINAVKPGISCKDIDAIARNFIAESGYANCFGHALGHGVGLEIHEKPFLSKLSDDILQPGMIITIEPGIYLANAFGVRIEDMLLVTADGHENLTDIEKELIIL